MPVKAKKYIALDKALFFVNDPIIHRRLGYTAVIKRILARGNAIIEIHNTPENQAIWACLKDSKGAYQIKAVNIVKHFKHQLEQPILNL